MAASPRSQEADREGAEGLRISLRSLLRDLVRFEAQEVLLAVVFCDSEVTRWAFLFREGGPVAS
jgi:hypothetical protein